jgi:hypothetical protein
MDKLGFTLSEMGFTPSETGLTNFDEPYVKRHDLLRSIDETDSMECEITAIVPFRFNR